MKFFIEKESTSVLYGIKRISKRQLIVFFFLIEKIKKICLRTNFFLQENFSCRWYDMAVGLLSKINSNINF